MTEPWILGAFANLVALLHSGFILLVVLGGVLVLRWPRLAWFQVPVAVYGILIMVFNWPCPLTDLELALREQAGQAPQWQYFINHHIFRHLGIAGDEWYVVPGVIVAIVAGNGWPYWRLIRR